MSGSFRTFLYPSKFTFLFIFFFLSFFLSFFQNQRRLQVRRAQKDAEGEMMVWCSSKLWRWWPRLVVSGSFKLFGSELLWCIYITGPEPQEATRLQLENKKEGLVAHLSATLCVHGDLELYRYHISSACLLVCLALQIIFKNFCNMFGFLKNSQSQNVISATLLCNNRYR